MKLPFKESALRRLPWEVGRGFGSGRASGRVGWAGLRVGSGWNLFGVREPCLTCIRCLRKKRPSEQWSCWRRNHPRTPKCNVDWYLGGLSGCKINAHFLRKAGFGTHYNIELRGVGGHCEVGVSCSDGRFFRRHRNQYLSFSESQTPELEYKTASIRQHP